MLVSFRKYTVLICATVCKFSARAEWRTVHAKDDNVALSRSNQHKWFEANNVHLFCQMRNRARFRRLLEPILVPRIVGTSGHQQVASHLASTLSALGFTIAWDRFNEQTPFGQRSFASLVATFDPNASRRLVLACHYDSKIIEGSVFIGATDSAVPCAMLLDLAESLGPLLSSRVNQDIALQLIFFDGEEAFVDWTNTDSLYGSRHLANTWKNQFYSSAQGSSFTINNTLSRIELFVLLDLLGAANPHFYNFAGHSSTNAFVNMTIIDTCRCGLRQCQPEVLKTYGEPLNMRFSEDRLFQKNCLHHLPRMFHLTTVRSGVEDDHLPFLQNGVPVLHLIPLPFPDVWHTTRDDASALNYETIDNINSILRVFVAQFLGLVP